MSRACPHFVLAAVAAIAAACFAAAPAAAGPACPKASAVPAQVDRKPLVRATLCLLNDVRHRHGLPPLRVNKHLSKAAQRHARDMAKRKYFSHTSRSGASFVDRIRRTGYFEGAQRWRAAENIAWGTGRRASPRAIIRGWMRSPGHRANILSRALREVGIGVAEDPPIARAGPGGTYATDFAKLG